MRGDLSEQNKSLPKGGGEMGELTRKKDWSKTSLGSPASWPQSLLTSLGIIIQSKFPMFIFWGTDNICFYNDAYRPSLGIEGKHPAALGKPGIEVWPEIWEVIKPFIDNAINTGEGTWREDQLIPIYRNGRLEDVYWTFSYSPINDESGNPGGVLVACTETTEKVRVLKEVKEKQEQLNFALDAASLATWDLDPVTNKFTGNARIKEWFGLKPENEIELSLALNHIVERDRQKVVDAIQTALMPGSDGKYEISYSIMNPFYGSERKVLAKGKALFNDNKAYRFSGILEDITSQTKAREKLETSEKHFRNIVEQAPIGISIFRGPEFFVEMANATYLNVVRKKEHEFVGKTLFEALPEVRDIVRPLLKNVYKTGIPYYGNEFPITLNRNNIPELTYFNFVYYPLTEEHGTITGIIVVANEVTESVKAKHALAESERQFRKLVMQSPVPMAIFRGKDYVIEMANTAMIELMWRKKPDEVFGKKALEVFPELIEQKYPELLNKVYSSGIIHRETESVAFVQGNDGLKKFYLDFEYAPLFEAEGNVSGIMITVNNVTEKVEARQKVEESEIRFKHIADSAPVLIWMSDVTNYCYFFNKAWLTFTGRTVAEESGTGWTSGIHTEDRERCNSAFLSAFSKREAFYIEYRLRRHDGEYRWISDSGVPRFIGEEFMGYIGACMDIHERVISGEHLKYNEERLSIVVAASDLATWELNVQTSEVSYSERYLEILGFKQGAKITHSEILQRLHPDDLPIRTEAFKEAYRSGALQYISRIIWSDGSIHWIEGRGKVFYDNEHKPFKLIGTLRDITEEKKYQQQLEEREQKFRLLADSMPQHIWTSDPEGNLNYFNRSVYDYSGLSAEEVATNGWLQIVHPDDRQKNILLWAKAIDNGDDFLLEHRFKRHDGIYRWQLSRAIPQKNSEGVIQMWVGTSTDIQDQKDFSGELEKQIQERTSELEEKNRDLEKMNAELQSFAYVSSHDLQEPLRKIQTFAGRILEKEYEHLSESGKDYFKRMQDAAKRMQTLIEDLLAYSRTNTTEKIFKTLPLHEIVKEVQQDLRELISETATVIEVGKMTEAHVIPFQFRQLLHNLIGNSIKFAKSGVTSHIKIESKTVEGTKITLPGILPHLNYCQLSLSDNGIGFDPQYKERIFEVFQRLHSKSDYKGTGIGLAIVKKIVDNHNGIITATAEINKGARFDIYIPSY
ncbi:hypothetical protein CNR22_14330 [Sphingobacteriaceae bacterium]|nr:hypothetical protein CNR22_14330 [Sphingobacteriaceae bacterium]